RLLLADLRVGDLGRDRDRVAAGLGLAGGAAEADGHDVVVEDLPVHDGVHVGGLLDDVEPAAAEELRDHLGRDLLVEAGLARPGLEERDADPVDRGIGRDAAAHEGVAAAAGAEAEDEKGREAERAAGPRPHRTTTLTRRLGTTTSFTISLPPTNSATRGSPRA